MICIAIVAIIAAIAIPNLIAAKAAKPGTTVRVRTSGVTAVVLALDYQTSPVTYLVRIDNGPEAKVRYTEARFMLDEIEVVPEKIEVERQ